ncbi:hypothetical protein LCGC14_1086020 [marine sediment metagenome]|uniref:Uncharacterized protein n=1 Tax=marine sediment metagenome TaxID=412755 RepID=A0A0F9N1C9_9ZZZZ
MPPPSRYYTEPPYHIRKILVATAGVPWADGVVEDLFIVTGRVFIARFTAFCTESLAGATATIKVGDESNDPDGLLDQITATDLVANDWWAAGTHVPGLVSIDVNHSAGYVASQVGKLAATDIVLTPATADVTDGTIEFDCWWEPVSADGNLEAA